MQRGSSANPIVAIKLKIPHSRNNLGARRGLRHDPVLRFAVGAFAIIAGLFVAFFSYYYVKYDRIIEKRFNGPVFANSAKIYAAPHAVSVGEKADVKEIAAAL